MDLFKYMVLWVGLKNAIKTKARKNNDIEKQQKKLNLYKAKKKKKKSNRSKPFDPAMTKLYVINYEESELTYRYFLIMLTKKNLNSSITMISR